MIFLRCDVFASQQPSIYTRREAKPEIDLDPEFRIIQPENIITSTFNIRKCEWNSAPPFINDP